MADVYAVNATTKFVDNGKVPSSQSYGRRRVTVDTYEAAALAADDYIIIDKLTEGSVILPQTSITHDALGTGVTLQLFVRASDGTETAVSTAYVTTSAGTINLDDVLEINTVPFTITRTHTGDLSSEALVVLQVAVGAATGTIKVALEYSVD